MFFLRHKTRQKGELRKLKFFFLFSRKVVKLFREILFPFGNVGKSLRNVKAEQIVNMLIFKTIFKAKRIVSK